MSPAISTAPFATGEVHELAAAPGSIRYRSPQTDRLRLTQRLTHRITDRTGFGVGRGSERGFYCAVQQRWEAKPTDISAPTAFPASWQLRAWNVSRSSAAPAPTPPPGSSAKFRFCGEPHKTTRFTLQSDSILAFKIKLETSKKSLWPLFFYFPLIGFAPYTWELIAMGKDAKYCWLNWFSAAWKRNMFKQMKQSTVYLFCSCTLLTK